MTDFSKLQMSSEASSNKVFKQGNGSFGVPGFGTSGEVVGSATIPHGFGSDKLIFQVSATTDLAGTSNQTTLPWQSNDGRVLIYAYLDVANLYIIRINSDSSGFGFPAATVSYTYRLLVP